MEDKIDQADTFNERVHRAIIDATGAIETKSVLDAVPSPPQWSHGSLLPPQL